MVGRTGARELVVSKLLQQPGPEVARSKAHGGSGIEKGRVGDGVDGGVLRRRYLEYLVPMTLRMMVSPAQQGREGRSLRGQVRDPEGRL